MRIYRRGFFLGVSVHNWSRMIIRRNYSSGSVGTVWLCFSPAAAAAASHFASNLSPRCRLCSVHCAASRPCLALSVRPTRLDEGKCCPGHETFQLRIIEGKKNLRPDAAAAVMSEMLDYSVCGWNVFFALSPGSVWDAQTKRLGIVDTRAFQLVLNKLPSLFRRVDGQQTGREDDVRRGGKNTEAKGLQLRMDPCLNDSRAASVATLCNPAIIALSPLMFHACVLGVREY